MGDKISDIKVKDVMTRSLASAGPSTTLYEIAKMMEQGGFGAIIIEEDNLPRAIITDRDFAIKVAVNRFPLETPVHKIASHPLQTINSNESM